MISIESTKHDVFSIVWALLNVFVCLFYSPLPSVWIDQTTCWTRAKMAPPPWNRLSSTLFPWLDSVSLTASLKCTGTTRLLSPRNDLLEKSGLITSKVSVVEEQQNLKLSATTRSMVIYLHLPWPLTRKINHIFLIIQIYTNISQFSWGTPVHHGHQKNLWDVWWSCQKLGTLRPREVGDFSCSQMRSAMKLNVASHAAERWSCFW